MLASKVAASVEYLVTVLPGRSGKLCPNHRTAVIESTELARARCVDAWVSEDHAHFVQIASFRGSGGPGRRQA